MRNFIIYNNVNVSYLVYKSNSFNFTNIMHYPLHPPLVTIQITTFAWEGAVLHICICTALKLKLNLKKLAYY